MKTIYDILKEFRDEFFSEKYKGIRFERLMRAWLKTDPRYTGLFETVWLWEEFPFRDELGGTDTGIDLVARTYSGDYWAIQCKCYAEDTVIDKSSVDSFLATSSRTFNTIKQLLPIACGLQQPIIGVVMQKKLFRIRIPLYLASTYMTLTTLL